MSSKYDLPPSAIFKMKAPELKNYIRSAYKSIDSKIRRFRKSEYADFSELLDEVDVLDKRYGGKLTGRTQGLSLYELQRKALDINTLFKIEETRPELEAEGKRNIKDIFKEPRYTREFIELLNRNEKILSKLVNKNETFIREILPSESINQIFNQDKSDAEKYKDVLLAVTDELDLRDNAEKEQIIEEKWDPVFERVSRTEWEDKETNEVVDVEKW